MGIQTARGGGRRGVLFVHGTPGDQRSFDAVIARAPEGVRVHRFDLPDHGAAPEEPEGRLAPLEDALVAAVERTEGPLTLVGHSLGAWLAASVDARLPSRVERVVAIGGYPSLAADEVALREGLLAQIEGGALDVTADLRPIFLELMLGEARTPALDERAWAQGGVSRERWVRLLKRMIELGQRAPVRCSRPTRLLHGRRDAAVPYAHAVALAAACVDAELVPLDTSSHLLPLTHPEALAAHVFGA
ncbi:MAG: alpha/beta hydrolase [Sandaracinaceae bacterium]|nr:alpha/beta hydrolase [Sandaracinaceae bacterium]